MRRRGGVPVGPARAVVSGGGLRQRLASERTEGFKEAGTSAGVVTHPEKLDGELRRGLGAHHHVNFLARLDRLP